MAASKTRHWRRPLDETYGVLERIRLSRTPRAVCEVCLDYAGRFGATNLLAGAIPPPNASRREQLSHVLLDVWPAEWSHRYFTNGYLYHDPTIRLVRDGSPPFLWSQARELGTANSRARRVMAEATDFGLKDGLTLAFADIEGSAIGFSIAGEYLILDGSDHQSLLLVTAVCLGQAIALIDGRCHRQTVALSPRQREALHWASEGLPVGEIGERMMISSHTADMHLRAVREKLGVTSSIHAVGEAFRRGLID